MRIYKRVQSHIILHQNFIISPVTNTRIFYTRIHWTCKYPYKNIYDRTTHYYVWYSRVNLMAFRIICLYSCNNKKIGCVYVV